MSCKIYKNMLHAYLGNELETFEKEAVQRHIQNCPDCSKETREIMQLKAVAAALKQDAPPLPGLKADIMSAIKAVKKVHTELYDIKVMGRLAGSMIACGILVFMLNFTSLGSGLEMHADKMNSGFGDVSKKITQPVAMINKGLIDLSTKIVNLNGITYRLEKKIRGGM